MDLKRGIKKKDIIYMKELRLKKNIGIFDEERQVKQKESIDKEFTLD